MSVIRVRKTRTGDDLLELCGEFDIAQAGSLADVVRGVSDAACDVGCQIFVDLSAVKFMDTMCLQELVVLRQVYAGRLMLLKPSRQVELGVAASGLEDWLRFHPKEAPAGKEHALHAEHPEGFNPEGFGFVSRGSLRKTDEQGQG